MTAQLVVVPSIETGADRRTCYGFVLRAPIGVVTLQQVLETTARNFRDFMSQPQYGGYVSEVAVVLGVEPRVVVAGITGQSVDEFMSSMDFMTPAYLRAAFRRALELEPGSPEDFFFPEDAVAYEVYGGFYTEYRHAIRALRRRG